MGCNLMLPKKELIRVVKSPEGEVSIDFKGKKNGRGAYICPKIECLQKARKIKRLEKSLKIKIPDELFSILIKEIEDNE